MTGQRFWRALGLLAAALVLMPGQLSANVSVASAHHIKTVFIILMENHNWTGGSHRDIKDNPRAPYINKTLIPMSSYANQYYNPPHNHPSLPNYLWLEAGTNFGIYNDHNPGGNEQETTKHFVTLLDGINVSWKAYLENTSGKACPLLDRGKIDQNGSPLYAVRHEPFTYFADVTGNHDRQSAYCIAHLRPFRELASDLANGTVPQYVWITPNLCDDMHDSCGGGPVEHGDIWLSKQVPAILNSRVYKDGGALFITWDEALKGDGPIPMIVLSPFAKGGGYSNAIHYTHGSTLRTFQEIFDAKPLLRDAKRQTDLSDLFSVFP